MSKKKKKVKSKFRNLSYSKTEFISNICSQCKVCKAGTDPVFCYDETYAKDPKTFMNVIYRNLLEVKRWLVNIGESDLRPDEDIQYTFQMSFCESNYCGCRPHITEEPCKFIAGCLSAFRNQAKSLKSTVIQLSDYRGRKEKIAAKTKTGNKKHYVHSPEPSFFCNEGFKEEIKSIVKEYTENRCED